MATQNAAATGPELQSRRVTEREAWSASGVPVLVLAKVKLFAEIAERVAPAGVRVIESGLTRLSYAAEIAQAMLRQQQAR